MRQALVLGANGFIGRWVTRELERRGVPLVLVARGALPPDLAPGASRIRSDLAIEGEAQRIVREVRPSHVFNLAGYGVLRDQQDAALAEVLNHHLVRELTTACAPQGNHRGTTLVHVGSAAEYGSVLGTWREDGPTQPASTYGTTKLAGTRALVEVARTLGTPATCARLFTVFGHGEAPGRLFPTLLAASTRTDPIPLSVGTQERDFAWVGDVAPALVDLALASWAPGSVVNLASGRMHTVQAFVRAAASALGIPTSRLQFGAVPSLPGDGTAVTVGVERMQQVLGRVLPGDLDDVVRRAVARQR